MCIVCKTYLSNLKRTKIDSWLPSHWFARFIISHWLLVVLENIKAEGGGC